MLLALTALSFSQTLNKLSRNLLSSRLLSNALQNHLEHSDLHLQLIVVLYIEMNVRNHYPVSDWGGETWREKQKNQIRKIF